MNNKEIDIEVEDIDLDHLLAQGLDPEIIKRSTEDQDHRLDI
mgnify:CR=1 FL=1